MEGGLSRISKMTNQTVLIKCVSKKKLQNWLETNRTAIQKMRLKKMAELAEDQQNCNTKCVLGALFPLNCYWRGPLLLLSL